MRSVTSCTNSETKAFPTFFGSAAERITVFSKTIPCSATSFIAASIAFRNDSLPPPALMIAGCVNEITVA
jgi:hypothetical protein